MAKEFIQAGNLIIHAEMIAYVDFQNLETKLEIVVSYFSGDGMRDVTIVGPQAIEALMILDPTALESRRLKWARNRWAIHNLIGHPLMQLCAFFKQYDLAMWIHDVTVPKPSGKKE